MHTYELFSSLKIKKIVGSFPELINNIHIDSRQVKQNSVFVCIKGYTVDGHDFVDDAIKRGAKVIVSEKLLSIDADKAALVIVKDTNKALALLANKFFDYPSKKMVLFGVTGTNGKTTVSNLIHEILLKAGERSGLIGTIGLDFNGEKFPSENTTSEVLTNQYVLQQALDRNINNMVMEVSSHGLVQGRLWGVDFDVVAFTNLSHDHLDYHKTMEHYGYAKGLLFAQLGQDLEKPKYIVLNYDDEWYATYSYMSPFEVISYGLTGSPDFKAEHIRYDNDHTIFTLLSPEGIFEVKTNLLGEFNVYNLLAAIACLYAKDMKVADIIEYIASIPPVNGRMEKVEVEAPLSVYIDYAHTADAIEKAINAVLPFKKNRIIFLVGTGGNRDKSKRPSMAEKASKADYVVLTTDDPRYESYESILTDLEKGMQHNQYALIGDRAEAVKHAINISQPNDIIIFAGKGHEDYQIIENTKVPHSDSEIAKVQAKEKYGESLNKRK